MRLFYQRQGVFVRHGKGVAHIAYAPTLLRNAKNARDGLNHRGRFVIGRFEELFPFTRRDIVLYGTLLRVRF